MSQSEAAKSKAASMEAMLASELEQFALTTARMEQELDRRRDVIGDMFMDLVRHQKQLEAAREGVLGDRRKHLAAIKQMVADYGGQGMWGDHKRGSLLVSHTIKETYGSHQ
jgi:hypothetical protein